MRLSFLSKKESLLKLSKRELIRRYIELEERYAKNEQYLKAFDNPHTPSSKQLKKNTKQDNKDNKNKDDNEKRSDHKKKARFPGKPKGSNGGGVTLPPPDEIKEHTLDISPVSGLPLGKPTGYWKKNVIDFPDKPIQVIEHRIMKYKDPLTGETVMPSVNLPKGLYGKNIKAVTALLKDLINSHSKIATLLREMGAPSFSSATVQSISTMFIFQLENNRTNILTEMRNAPYIHADETTMRRDGKGGYAWVVCTNFRAAFLAAKGRGKLNIIKLLRNFKGVLVVDGYGGYDWYPLKQRCWAHLIREFKEHAKNNDEIQVQYKRLKNLYETLKELNTGPPDEREIAKAKWTLNDIVVCLRTIRGARKLRKYIQNAGDDWFTALYYEGVPLHNNLAERELRPIVLLRKTIGCYRNWKGKRWLDVVVSVLHTWKLQGKNLFKSLREIAI